MGRWVILELENIWEIRVIRLLNHISLSNVVFIIGIIILSTNFDKWLLREDAAQCKISVIMIPTLLT